MGSREEAETQLAVEGEQESMDDTTLRKVTQDEKYHVH
jgi:hypothetical protein